MPDPGYGPGGFKLRPTGRVTWEGNAPPRIKASETAGVPTKALGTGTMPRRVEDTEEAFRRKEA